MFEPFGLNGMAFNSRFGTRIALRLSYALLLSPRHQHLQKHQSALISDAGYFINRIRS